MAFAIWNTEDNLTLINGLVMTADEVRAAYPITARGDTLLELTADGRVGGIDNLNDAAARYGIDPALPDDEKLKQVEQAIIRQRDPNYDAINEMLDIIEGKIEIEDETEEDE